MCNKNSLVILLTYNNSNFEQQVVCSVQLRYKDKAVRCRFFVVPGDGPALVGMLGIKLLGLLKIACQVLDQQQADRNFNPQTRETSGVPEHRTNTTNTSSAGITNNCINMPE